MLKNQKKITCIHPNLISDVKNVLNAKHKYDFLIQTLLKIRDLFNLYTFLQKRIKLF